MMEAKQGQDQLESSSGAFSTEKSYSQIIAEKIASLLKEARKLSAEGNPGLAVRRLTRAIALKQDDPELFRERGEANALLHNYHAASINFHKVIGLREDQREKMSKRLSVIYYDHGVANAAEQKFEEAVEMFENALKYDNENKAAVTRRMECLVSMRRYSECMGLIENEVGEDSENPNLLVVRAQMHILFGQITMGYEDVCSALRFDPEHPEALEMMDDLQKKALECKNEAIRKSLLGKKADALIKLNSAIDTDPSKAEYLVLRGSLCRSMGDFNAAVDDLLQAMDKCQHRQDSPVYISASKQLLLTYNSFAMECFRQRHFDSAVTLLNKAIKQEKMEKGLYLNRGDCFYRMGELQFALSDYQQALELEPFDWEVFCRVAIVCCEMGVELFRNCKFSEAEQLFSAAIQHNPKVCWFYTCRAKTRYHLKDIHGSRADILFSLVLDPKSDDCVTLIACVYPGISKSELLCSQEALEAQVKLQAVLRHVAIQFVRTSDQGGDGDRGSPSDVEQEIEGLSPKAAFHLKGLCLKMEKDEEVEKQEPLLPQPVSAVRTTSSIVLSSQEHLTTLDDTSMEVEGKEEGAEKGEEEGKLYPRKWCVLSCPIPELPCAPQSLLSMLQESVKEAQFHQAIYYSKKKCDKELVQALRVPTEAYVRPPPPRIQNIKDVVIGGRSILTASSLIKSLKR